MQEAVEGLALYARLGDAPHLNSSLAIRMTEGVGGSSWSLIVSVEMAEEHGVTVILLYFTRPAFFYQQPDLLYYLVYDSIGRSLSMFQILSHPCQARRSQTHRRRRRLQAVPFGP
jgi:hypothetical protein